MEKQQFPYRRSSVKKTGTWWLLGVDGKPYSSGQPGTLGGHRRTKIYGLLDCRAALRAIGRGGYVAHRVFFLNEDQARAAGYRPCGICLREKYKIWRSARKTGRNSKPRSARARRPR
jgi:hypothetical protein